MQHHMATVVVLCPISRSNMFTFVFLLGSGTLKSTISKEEAEAKARNDVAKVTVELPPEDKEDTTLLPGEKEVQPVGESRAGRAGVVPCVV